MSDEQDVVFRVKQATAKVNAAHDELDSAIAEAESIGLHVELKDGGRRALQTIGSMSRMVGPLYAVVVWKVV